VFPAGRLPVLETALDDVHAKPVEVAAGGHGQVRAKFDASDLEAPAGQGQGGLAGGAADFQHAITWCQPGDGDEAVEQFAGVVGTCPEPQPLRSSSEVFMPAVPVPAASSRGHAR